MAHRGCSIVCAVDQVGIITFCVSCMCLGGAVKSHVEVDRSVVRGAG
jgi:hypothetical protein